MSDAPFGKTVKEVGKSISEVVNDSVLLFGQVGKTPKRFVKVSMRIVVAATGAALLGALLLTAAYYNPAAAAEGLIIVLRTIAMWGAFGVLVFGLAFAFGGAGTLSQTLGVIFKVMPIAYVGAAVAAVLAAILVRPFLTEDWRFIVPTAISVAMQAALVALFLPPRISALHKLATVGRVSMYSIPALVLVVNVVFSAWPTYYEWKDQQKVPAHQQGLKIGESKLPIYWPILQRPELQTA